jgi:pilus assembly protein CpaF
MELHERLSSSDVVSLYDPFAEVKSRIHLALIEHLGGLSAEGEIDQATLRARVIGEIRARLDEETGISREDRERLVSELADDILGNGPLERLLTDDTVTEIMVNGPYDVWVERAGTLRKSTARFTDESHVRRVMNKMVAEVGRRIDESQPMVDARLPDGSRLNAVIPPLSLGGALLTIRKFGSERLDLDALVKLGTLDENSADFLLRCVQARLNMLISGGTGSGKTTMLNALSAGVPDSERIVTIEDAAELKLSQRHVLRMETRPRNIEGEGEVTIRDLVRNSLRMRPDRIIVGEVRGAEALDMLQAMSTGHDGSLSTVHSNSPRDALTRIETMVLMAGYDLPVKAIRQRTAAAIDLIVHLERVHDGSRKVMAITEVQRMESDMVTLQDLFVFHVEGVGSDRKLHGKMVNTGLRPHFVDKFEKRGVELPGWLRTFDQSAPVVQLAGRESAAWSHD